MPTNFLWDAGTSNNGLLTSAITLLSTELNSLATTDTVTSSVGGSSGVFTNSNTAQAMWADIFLTLGAVGTALSAGATVAGWFLTSPDGGTTFETPATNTAPPRPPDFVILLPATTITAGWAYKAMGLVLVPALEFKVYLQNSSGQTWASSGNTLKLAPVAAQY